MITVAFESHTALLSHTRWLRDPGAAWAVTLHGISVHNVCGQCYTILVHVPSGFRHFGLICDPKHFNADATSEIKEP